jgi:hypothetical protein
LISVGKVTAIVAEGYPAIIAAKQITNTVPIIMAVSSDPIATGLVSSLSHPGGNVTGLTTLSTDLNGRRLQLLKEAVPAISCVALVWASLVAPDKEAGLKEAQRAAEALGLQVQHVEIRNIDDWRAAVVAVSNARPKPDAVFQLCDPVTLSRRKALVDFAANSRLPSMYEMKEYVIKFRQYKPIGAYPETCVGLGRFIEALLSLAAALFGGDASSHWRAMRMLVVHPWITVVAAGRPATTRPGLMRSNCVDQQIVESW